MILVTGGINKIEGRRYNMSDVATLLNCGFGRNQLYDWLKSKKIIDQYNIPAMEYIESGFIAYENKIIKRQRSEYRSRQIYFGDAGVSWLRQQIAQDRQESKY